MWHNLKFNYLKKKKMFPCRCPGLLRGRPQGGGQRPEEAASGQTCREEPGHPPEDLQCTKEGQTWHRCWVTWGFAVFMWQAEWLKCVEMSPGCTANVWARKSRAESQTKTLFCLYLTRKPLGSKILYNGDRSKEAHSYRAAKIWNINIRKHGG